jgi:hypothetical protein
MPHKKHQTRPPSQHHFHGVIENLHRHEARTLAELLIVMKNHQCVQGSQARDFLADTDDEM